MKIRQLCIAGIALVSNLASTSRLAAQVVPDTTLPNNSIVIPNQGNLLLIEGGTAAGGNLFHSFEGFSVPANSTAVFNNSPQIQNIFSRVTGSSVSNIEGILGANGLVNLFFLNPNGIVFGPNAQLQIGGSFLATTANSIEFANGSFSATNPEAPPLLVINIPTSLEFGSAPGSIVNRSQAAPEGFPSNSIGGSLGLAVLPGRTLALAGGDVILENGNISAFEGRIELGSVAGSGSVGFVPREMGFALDYEGIENFGNIRLSQNSVAEASGRLPASPTEPGGRGGEIQVRGDKLTVENSGITSSTFSSLESPPGGNLSVTASEIEISGTVVGGTVFPPISSIPAGLFNQTEGTGQGGNLTIQTQRLTVKDGAQVSTATSSQGQGGFLAISASDSIELSGISADGNNTPTSLSSESRGSGDAGNFTIVTPVLTVKDGAQVSAATSGQGQGGALTVTASNSIELAGTSVSSGIPSGLSSETRGAGNAGNLALSTSRLTVRDGAQVSTATSGEGQGGALTVTASDSVELAGTSVSGIASGLFSEARGSGSAGNLALSTPRLTIRDGAQVSTATSGQGQGGSLTVTAFNSIELTGTSTSGITSGLFSEARGAGSAGNLAISTANLTVRDGAQVSTATSGEGQGGALTVTASDSIELIGTGTTPNDIVPSSLSSQTIGNGNAGELTVNTANLTVRDGAQLSTDTFNQGQGGDLTVTASDSIELTGTASSGIASGLFSQTRGSGNAGALSISTDRLTVRDGAEVSTTAFDLGNPGNLSILASDLVRVSDAGISSATANSTGGNASIDARQLIVENGGQILATTVGSGRGGNLTVNAAESVELVGTRADGSPSGLFTQSQGIAVESGAGDAGNLSLSTRRLTVTDGATISADTFADGLGGSVTINASESIQVTGRSASPPALPLPSVDDDGLLPSRLSVFSQGSGNAGSLNIETERLTVEDKAQIAVDGRRGTGAAGSLEIAAPEIFLDAGILTAETASGTQGNITLNTRDLQLRDASQINTNAGSSQGGNININTSTLAAVQNSDITANAQAGPGGRVSVNAQGIFGTEFQERLTNLSDITATSDLGPQFDGVVDINTPDIDPSRGLVELEEELVDVAGLIDRNPCRVTAGSRFVETGKGGLPPNPTETLSPTEGWEDWRGSGLGADGGSGLGGSGLGGSGLGADGTDGADGGSGLGGSGFGADGGSGLGADGGSGFGADGTDGGSGFVADGADGGSGFVADGADGADGVWEGTPVVEASGWELDGEGNLVLTGNGGMPRFEGGSSCSPRGTKNIGAGGAGTGALPLQVQVGSVRKIGAGTGALPLQVRAESAGKSVPETFAFVGFEVRGSTVFGRERLAEITEEFDNEELTFEELLEVSAAISELYKEEGYIGSGAVIPPQRVLNGIAMVRVVENKLEADIEVATEGRLTPNYVKGRLGLKPGDVVNREELLEALRLLRLDPLIKKVSAELSAGLRPNTSFLEVRVEEVPLLGAGLGIDNGRSPSVGTFRRQARLQARSLLGLGDIASLAYTNTDGSDTWDFGYTIPINASNGSLGLRYSSGASDIIEPPFDRADIEANSRSYDVTYRQPLIETIQGEKSEFATTRFALGLSASRQESETSLLGFSTPLSPGANDKGETRISALRFFQEWTRQENRQIFAARSQFSLGVGWFNATVNNNEPDSRFFSWRGQGQWVRQLGSEQFSPVLLVEGDMQLSPSSLVPLEQFSLGGQNSVRGYRQDARLADNGAFTSVELRYPILPLRRWEGMLEIIPFLDAGVAWNSDGNSSPSPNTLVGAGLGLQLQLGRSFRARLDWGVPLVDVDSRDRTWQENGLYFSVESGLF